MAKSIIVWKDGSYKEVDKNYAWEYENDKDWLVTIESTPSKGEPCSPDQEFLQMQFPGKSGSDIHKPTEEQEREEILHHLKLPCSPLSETWEQIFREGFQNHNYTLTGYLEKFYEPPVKKQLLSQQKEP